MTAGDQAPLVQAAAEVVLQASREGRLVTLAEVLAALATGGADAPDVAVIPPPTEEAAGLAGELAAHPRVASFPGLSGQTVYHAPELLSRTYALILDRKGSPLVLMAEEIRANSRDYPRPLPVELFQAPPFDLAPEEIARVLRLMAADPRYQDITFTRTSSEAVYLFSSLHLERGYARFLAERAESLALNP